MGRNRGRRWTSTRAWWAATWPSTCRAVEVEVDSSGRMLVPENLREYAGLSAKVVIIGVVNRVEMWEAKSWDSFRNEYSKKTDALAEKLGSAGIF